MTTLLLVEDDPAQLKMLSRAISLRRPDYSVLCAASGREAIALLEREDIELVLTDLQMSEMTGFELLAWLGTHRPAIIAFTMTAYGNPETQSRLAHLGSIECFTKPINLAGVLQRFSESLAQRIRGHVQNVSLGSFLQLLEMEQKTCTLTVQGETETGKLFLRKGQLIDAHTADRTGDEAATAIIGWPSPSITIVASCAISERVITTPMSFLVMEAMRLRDEMREAIRVRESVGRVERAANVEAVEKASSSRDSFFDFAPMEPTPDAEPAAPGAEPGSTAMAAPRLPPEPPDTRAPESGRRLAASPRQATVRAPYGAMVVAVIEANTGTVLARDGRESPTVGEMAASAASMFRLEQDALVAGKTDESIEELLFTTRSRHELIRPLPGSKDVLALLVFDPGEMSLVMARFELDQVIKRYGAP